MLTMALNVVLEHEYLVSDDFESSAISKEVRIVRSYFRCHCKNKIVAIDDRGDERSVDESRLNNQKRSAHATKSLAQNTCREKWRKNKQKNRKGSKKA